MYNKNVYSLKNINSKYWSREPVLAFLSHLVTIVGLFNSECAKMQNQALSVIVGLIAFTKVIFIKEKKTNFKTTAGDLELFQSGISINSKSKCGEIMFQFNYCWQ